MLNRTTQKRKIRFKRMQAVVNYNVHATLQGRLRPKISNSMTIKLIAVKGFDPIFLKQATMINVGPINLRYWKKLTPTAKRRSRLPIQAHVRNKSRIIAAQPEFEYPKRLLSSIMEKRRIDGRVCMETFALIAPIPSHNTAHFSGSECVYAVKLAYKSRFVTLGNTNHFRVAPNK
jgi:hypothetical protein